MGWGASLTCNDVLRALRAVSTCRRQEAWPTSDPVCAGAEEVGLIQRSSGDALPMKKDGMGRAESFDLGAFRGVARHFVGPFEQSVQVRVGRSRHDAGAADDDLAASPVNGDERAFGDCTPAGSHRGVGDIDGEVRDPHDGWFAHRSCDDGGVAGRPSTGSDDSGGGSQAVHVEWGGLWPHQDDRTFRGHTGCFVGGGRDPADRDTRTGAQPSGEDIGLVGRHDAGCAGYARGAWVRP
jgi:hypothetical protein